MDKKTAQLLIEDTFNKAFNEKQFTVFTKNLLNDLEAKNNFYTGNLIWDDYKEHINTYKRIGKYVDPEGEALDVLIVEVKSLSKLERARTALRNFVIKHLSKFEKDYALVAFYSKEDGGADWRFSFIKLEYRSELDEEKGKVKLKKEFTPAKRYSFLVGKYEKAYTAKNQLLPLLQNIANNPTIEELETAFSIEKVTDEFFSQYKDLYIKLYEHFENDSHVKAAIERAKIDNTRFTKKLLGQIVFLYFLQKKGWLGVAQNERWGTGKKRFVQELFEQSKAEGVNFFKDKLQYLFYEALAKERDNVNSYYKRFDCRIPFLNGGLFEADYDWQNADITIPENLFRNVEKNKAGDVGTGVLDVFDRYNFTIKEDEPLDKEVAVDPEMLGKVFENMLDIIERKSKGAFYTPREIVHYMCQESLIHYLDNAVGEKVEKKDLETFIREGHFALENDERVAAKGETKTYKYHLPESIRQNADLIDRKLIDIRICDPAIGSGAFPVGLLHELVNAMLVLKPHLSYDYLTEKLKGFGFEHRENVSVSRYIYRLKRHIIQESIYGVDIDASAIDIARLRLWLSLVVDEDDLDPIETLPNLDYKIVCGNSLIGLPDGAMRDLNVEAELEKLKERFYNITDEKEKKSLRQQINVKIRELLDSAEQFAGYKIDFDFKLFFSEVWREKGGFDIVIGNPPYVDIKQLPKDLVKFLFKEFKSTENRINLYSIFIEKGLRLGQKEGALVFINPNSMLLNSSYKKLRKLILNNLVQVIKLPDGIFKEAIVETIIIQVSANYINAPVFGAFYKKNDTINFENLKFREFNRELWKKDSDLRISIFSTPEQLNILKNIESNKEALENSFELCLGITPYDKYKGHTEEQIKNRIFHSSEKISNEYVPLISGANIQRFFVDAENIDEYLKYGDWLGAPRQKKFFSNPRVIVRQIISGSPLRIYAGYTEKELYHTQIGFSIIPKSDSKVSPKVLCAYLNSEVLNFYHKYKFLDIEKNTFQKILIENCKAFPFDSKLPMYLKTLEKIQDYNFLLASSKKENMIQSFFDELNNSVFYELYFPEEIKLAGKEILKHLGDLKPLADEMSEEEKLTIIQSEFERLYDPNHPVRFAIETLDNVEEVRIIKEALK